MTKKDWQEENASHGAFALTQDEIDFYHKKEFPEWLEKEVDRWRHEHFHGKRDEYFSGEYLERESQMDLALHFVEWQRKQDQELIELAEDHAMLAGMNKMKQEMMEKAIYYIAQPDIATGNIQIPFIRIGYTALSRYGIRVGDKVKVIVIPEEK